MIQTFEKTAPAAFSNKQQESLEALQSFLDSGISTKATDQQMRETLEDERLFEIEKH